MRIKITIFRHRKQREIFPHSSRRVGKGFLGNYGGLAASALFFGFALAPWLVADDGGSAVTTPSQKTAANAPQTNNDQSTEKFGDWVTTSGAAAVVGGDKAQFMQRHGVNKDFSGGIEDFSMQKDISKDTSLQMEGHGLFDVHDYNFKLGVDKRELGHWNVGYNEFRTWYDGSGGFFPQNSQWFSLYDNQMAVNRGKAWFEGELTLSDLPVFGFKYTYEFRDGMKDSLIWGDSNLTGGLGTRNIVPSFRTLNERRDIFDGYMTDTVDETTYKTGFKYETTADNDSLNVRLNPYEAMDRSSTQKETRSSNLFGFYGSTETWFSEKDLFTTAYSLSTTSTRFGGSLIYGPGYNAPFDVGFPNLQGMDNGYIDLNGGTQGKKTVVALNLMISPWDDLTLSFGLRPDRQEVDGTSDYLATNATGALDQTYMHGQHSDASVNIAENFETRYKGIQNWAFYARGDWKEENGTVTEDLRSTDVSALGAVASHYDSDQERFDQKYAVGSNWYPLGSFNLGAQYYHQIRSASYVTRNDALLENYPGLIVNQNQTTDDFNIRTTWRLSNRVTSTSRYDYQETRFDSQMRFLAAEESGRNNQHIFGESIAWNPLASLYFQGSVNYSINRTETPLNGFMGAVTESRNDYLTTSLTSGYALNDKTDLQLQYTYYFAPDYYNNSTSGMPYGSGAEEHSVTLAMTRRITDQIQWTLKYGFYNNRDQLYGGNEDYNAHLVYSGVRMAF